MSSAADVNTLASKSSEQQAHSPAIVHASESDKTCVVCFKIVDIFSIGECDHPVCYECSTRMRVLCKQNECPICRRINQKVIFTSEILPYKELDQKNRLCLYDKQYRICFTGQRAQNAFRRLLEHTCNKCNIEPFDSAAELKDHLRKNHELFYCDICMEHLKIFSFERRAYTREQLAMHRRKGDPDNKSHRGHPLCEFCDERYLDRDELFRHLRKEHYFCHYCDADGSNHFYPDHTRLREHFIDQHFLCEEGECKENIFTAAFRSDIDLKAHKANIHGQTSKQARTIEFQFNLAPRGRVNQENHNVQNPFETSNTSTSTSNLTRKIIDARNEQEFPSLGNAPINIRPTVALNMRPSTSGLARTKENFPALGGSSSQREPFKPPSITQTGNASTFLFKTTAKPASTNNNTSNKNGATNKAKSTPIKSNDFPSLPGSSSSSKLQRSNIESDMIETPLSFSSSALSSKHRVLIQSFDTSSPAANALANQKIKTIQRTETKPQSLSNDHVPSIKSKENFPALGGESSSVAAPQWLNGTNSTGKKQPQMSKKLKVAPAPILPTSKSFEINKKDDDTSKKVKSKLNQNEKKRDKTDNSNGKKMENEKQKRSDDSARKTNENNEKNSNANKSEKKIYDSIATEHNGDINTNGIVNSYSSVAHFTMPPPGFPAKKNEKSQTIPPGFENVSNGSYMSPSNALQRNQILVSHFMKSLKAPAVEEFRNLSKLFRSGLCNARSYYEHCEAVLGERFENIFPELLALLPDINKQQELYHTYIEKHNEAKSNDLNKLHKYIQVCDRCRQLLKRGDVPEHIRLHNEIETDNKLNKNFPKLSIKK